MLDHPLPNLDAKLRAEMRLQIKRIHLETCLTTVCVTHDHEGALSLSDKIVLMNAGTVQQIGDPRQIWRSPSSRFVADFIGVENLLPGRIERRGGETAVRLEGGHLVFPSSPAEAMAEDVVVGIRASDVRLADGADAGTAIDGRIVDRDYRGAVSAYRVETTLSERPLTDVVDSDEVLSGAASLGLPPDRLLMLPPSAQKRARTGRTSPGDPAPGGCYQRHHRPTPLSSFLY